MILFSTTHEGENEMKTSRVSFFVIVLMVLSMLASCAPAATPAPAQPAASKPFGAAACAPNCQYKDMTMCFPQLGAESDWRTADTASFKDTATKDGFKLVFSDAQQKQENQISAVRS